MFIIPALLAVMLLICGFATDPVDLLKDHLIDLDKAIELAQWGTGEEDVSEEEDEDETEAEPAGGAAEEEDPTPPSVMIRIRGKQIFIEGAECGAGELEEKIRSVCSGDERVLLHDDYAEAHVYRNADAILAGLSDEIGFTYEPE